ncbi:14976_t:CDS:2, partial [Funneliformis geosporum]
MNKEKPLTLEQIEANLKKIKLKLTQFSLGLINMTASILKWDDPLTSQNFSAIREICGNFVASFSKHQKESTSRLLKHDSSWKESLEIRKDIILEILSTIKNFWNNPAFGPNYATSLNKGTY